jgi:RNA polymerase sigma-70 factor (ECF subfamily)
MTSHRSHTSAQPGTGLVTSGLGERFETHRPRLTSIAYRMLGSVGEAEDAVQDAWLRLSRADVSTIRDLEGWLITAVARVCIDHLRSRRARAQEANRLPDPIVVRDDPIDPEAAALLSEALGLAFMVVLDRLTPAERIAFVLHDALGLPFDEIAAILGKTTPATRQLASRARRRVRGAPLPSGGIEEQRDTVTAFLTAARAGNFERLVEILDPDVVVRADLGPHGRSREVRGAKAVASEVLAYAQFTRYARPAIINGTPGIVGTRDERPSAVMAFTVTDRHITEIDIIADPERLTQVDLGGLDA